MFIPTQSSRELTDRDSGSGSSEVQIFQALNISATPTLITAVDAGNTISVLNLNHAGSGGVVISGLDSVIAAGSGTVIISSNSDTIITGDLRNQMIVGGGGNDTIISGAGNDTIIGGAGNDVFGFIGDGSAVTTVIADFSEGDRLNFIINGITTIEQLKALITTIDTADNNFTAYFVDGSALTLVGISVDQITADLIDFG